MSRMLEGNMDLRSDKNLIYDPDAPMWMMTDGEIPEGHLISFGHDDTSQITKSVISQDEDVRDDVLDKLKQSGVLPSDKIYLYRTVQSAIDEMNKGKIIEATLVGVYEAASIETLLKEPMCLKAYYQLDMVIQRNEFEKLNGDFCTRPILESCFTDIHHEAHLEGWLPDLIQHVEPDDSGNLTYTQQIDFSMESLMQIMEDEWLKPNQIEYILEGVCCSDSRNEVINDLFSDKMRDCLMFELTNENYTDLPLMIYLPTVMTRIENEYAAAGYPHAKRNMDHLYNEIKKKLDSTYESFCPNQRNLNELTPMDPTNYYSMENDQIATRSVAKLLDRIDQAETDEELTECFCQLARMNYALEGFTPITEGKKIRQVARNTSEKVRSGVRKVSKTTRETKRNISKVTSPMEKFIATTMDKIKKADEDERRAIIIKGGILPKVQRWVKRGIGLLIGSAVGTVIPAAALISGIAFIGWICTDKYFDSKTRYMVLRELEDEIQVVNEKIDDSRSDEDKQKKYELMRIRNKLVRTSEKIRLNLKH